MRELKFSQRYFRGLFQLAPWMIAVIAVALWATRCDTSQAQRPVVVNPGRYQLFNGQNGDVKALIKIDTETGATWFVLTRPNEQDKNHAVEGWAPIATLQLQDDIDEFLKRHNESKPTKRR